MTYGAGAIPRLQSPPSLGYPRGQRMRRALVFVALFAVSLAACEDTPEDAREAQITSVLAAADEPLIRARPALAAGKYTRMALAPFDFYRGSVPLYRSDMRSGTTSLAVSRFGMDLPLVPSLGDPHPENFGILEASDGTLALEPNDFDAADRAPYLWDVRRLTSGMALGAMLSNPDDEAARARTAAERRAIARAAAAGYRAGVEAAASGSPPGRVESPGPNPILADLFERSREDQEDRAELDELTVLEAGVRRLRRGVIDPEDPQNVYADLPPNVFAALPAAVEKWRRTIIAAPAPETFTILDAAREFGSGVASWPRVRIILLVRGPSDDPDDDIVLEMKELVDSTIAGFVPPGVYHDDVGRRVLETSRGAWARPDGEWFWGVTELLGLRCQIRLESEGQKNARVARWVDEQGTPEALSGFARVLGEVVARVHTSGPDGLERARAIYGRIALDPEGFLDEQADAGVAYAELALADHARFVRALHRHGLRLGIPFDEADAPRPDLAALFGFPPPPPALPSPP